MKAAISRIVLALLLAGSAHSSAAISLSSLDSFSSTNQGWQIGTNGSQPAFNSGTSFDGQPGFVTQL